LRGTFPSSEQRIRCFSHLGGRACLEDRPQFNREPLLESLKHGVPSCQKDVLQQVGAAGMVGKSLVEDARCDFHDPGLVQACNRRLEDNFRHANALYIQMELVLFPLALLVEWPRPTRKGMIQTLRPVLLSFSCLFLCEVCIVF
jgi:hypothetical protein